MIDDSSVALPIEVVIGVSRIHVIVSWTVKVKVRPKGSHFPSIGALPDQR
jgi:hypothetical protein